MSKMHFAESEEKWLKLRVKHITGSDVGGILGYNKHLTLQHVRDGKHCFENKTKKNFLMELGSNFENKLARIYKEWHHNPYYISKCKRFMATCDFVSKNEHTLIEVKTTTGEARFKELMTVPKTILYQIIHQYICSGAKFKEVYLVIYLIDKSGKSLDRSTIELQNLPKVYPPQEEATLDEFYQEVIVKKNTTYEQSK